MHEIPECDRRQHHETCKCLDAVFQRHDHCLRPPSGSFDLHTQGIWRPTGAQFRIVQTGAADDTNRSIVASKRTNFFAAGICVALPPVEKTPAVTDAQRTWARKGKWVHLAKRAFEKYFLHKVRSGNTDPVYERCLQKALGIERLRA